MGEIIKAICDCGYQSKELKFGAGPDDFEHSRTVPAISMTTAEIVELDILAKSPNPRWAKCPHFDLCPLSRTLKSIKITIHLLPPLYRPSPLKNFCHFCG